MMLTLIQHNLSLYFKNIKELIYIYSFFIITIVFYALTLIDRSETLSSISIHILWINLLLSTMLALAHFYREDQREGRLQQWVMLPCGITVVIMAKLIAFWLMTLSATIITVPVIAILLNMEQEVIVPLMAGLILGAVTLTAIGHIMSVLLMGSHQASSILLLLTLPFMCPVLIFGISATADANVAGWLGLIGYVLFSVPLSVIVSGYLIRHSG